MSLSAAVLRQAALILSAATVLILAGIGPGGSSTQAQAAPAGANLDRPGAASPAAPEAVVSRIGTKAPAGEPAIFSQTLPAPGQETRERALDTYGKLPLLFIENQGQIKGEVSHYLHAADKQIYFHRRGLTFVLTEPSAARAPDPRERLKLADAAPAPRRQAVGLEFVNARPVGAAGAEQAETLVSYLKGPKDRWKSAIPTYHALRYAGLWDGIDLHYQGTRGALKYSFHLKPHADPETIKLAYRGADAVTLTDEGGLTVETAAGTLHDGAPIAWQDIEGKRIPVPARFTLTPATDRTVVGFALGDYDKTQPLVLDPAVLVYASFIGGSGADYGYGIAVDTAGSAYVTGYTGSTEASFPDGDGFGAIPGFDQTYNGGTYDAFVVKLNAAGTALTYATYIGGTGDDYGRGIAVDSSGSAYVTGYTTSTQATFPDGDPNDNNDFAGVPGFDQTHNGGGEDAFVVKLNAAGTALTYATYIGGSGADRGYAIAVDSSGSAYVTGYTASTEATFPDGDPNDNDDFAGVSGFDQIQNDSTDAFVVKLNAAGTALTYATYIGGSGTDIGYAIAVDSSGSAYVTGYTASNEATFPDGDPNTDDLFPAGVPGFDQTHNGGIDAFVVKLSAAGTALSYATFIGGNGTDRGYAIAVDAAGSAYVTGETDSNQTTFPDGDPDFNDNFAGVPGFDQIQNGGLDAFVVKLNAAGTALSYATYIGGSSTDVGLGIAVDAAGSAYVTGEANSNQTTFPDGDPNTDDLFPAGVPGFDQTHNGLTDVFVVKLNAAGTALIDATFIGGSGTDIGYAIAVDSSGSAYVTGYTRSTQTTFPDGDPDANDNFAGAPGFDQTHNGGTDDAFVVKLSEPSGGGGGGNPGPTVTILINGQEDEDIVILGLQEDTRSHTPVKIEYKLHESAGLELFVIVSAPALGINFSYLDAAGNFIPLPSDYSKITPYKPKGLDPDTYTLFNGILPAGVYELYIAMDFTANGYLDYQYPGILNGRYDYARIRVY